MTRRAPRHHVFRMGVLSAGALALAACGAGAAGEAIQPTPPTAASALGQAACSPERYGVPLIVDWPGDARVDLEAAMKTGVAVVAYDCKTLRLLRECGLEGSYGFLGTTRDEQTVRLANGDEIGINLPTTGAALSAELARGMTLDVTMVLIGKLRTTISGRLRSDLRGRCEGATHFVRGATVGAFTLETTAAGSAGSDASVLGVGATAKSSADKKTISRAGDFGACEAAAPGALRPPDQCGAPLRLELVALDDAPRPGGAAAPTEREIAAACPRGMIMEQGKCAPTAGAHPCAPGAVDDCRTQCDRGDAASCASLGVAYVQGRGAPRDEAQAAARFRAACDKGDARGCNGLGVLVAAGRGVEKDPARAAELFKKACDGGEEKGCLHLGDLYAEGSGVPKDEAQATDAFRRSAELSERACDGGDPSGCVNWGFLLEKGRGVDKDVGRAAALYRRACDGGSPLGCSNLGAMYQNGRGVDKDEARAAELYQRACDGDQPLGCSNLGAMYQNGRGVDKDEARAAALYKKACAAGSAAACEALGEPR